MAVHAFDKAHIFGVPHINLPIIRRGEESAKNGTQHLVRVTVHLKVSHLFDEITKQYTLPPGVSTVCVHTSDSKSHTLMLLYDPLRKDVRLTSKCDVSSVYISPVESAVCDIRE